MQRKCAVILNPAPTARFDGPLIAAVAVAYCDEHGLGEPTEIGAQLLTPAVESVDGVPQMNGLRVSFLVDV